MRPTKARAEYQEMACGLAKFGVQLDDDALQESSKIGCRAKTTKVECLCSRTFMKSGLKDDAVKAKLLKHLGTFVMETKKAFDVDVDPKDEMHPALWELVDAAATDNRKSTEKDNDKHGEGYKDGDNDETAD